MSVLLPGHSLASPTSEIILTSVILLLVLLVGAGGAVWLRRKLLDEGGAGSSAGQSALDIGQLDRMHQAGQLTDEEFKLLRKTALGLEKPQDETKDSASSGPPSGVDGTGDGSARPGQKSNEDEGL